MEVTKPDGLNLNNAIIKVGASWCSACKEADKWIRKYSSKYPGVTFYVVDVDTFKRGKDRLVSAQVRKVSSMPTFLLYSQGKLVRRIEGFNSSKLDKRIRKYL